MDKCIIILILLPIENERPAFGQLFIVDQNEAEKCRKLNSKSKLDDEEI